jgi:hypothetical protein
MFGLKKRVLHIAGDHSSLNSPQISAACAESIALYVYQVLQTWLALRVLSV